MASRLNFGEAAAVGGDDLLGRLSSGGRLPARSWAVRVYLKYKIVFFLIFKNFHQIVMIGTPYKWVIMNRMLLNSDQICVFIKKLC